MLTTLGKSKVLTYSFHCCRNSTGGGGGGHAIKLGLAETIESNADMKLELVCSVHSTILMQQTKQNTIL
jgi:hypothetical protein